MKSGIYQIRNALNGKVYVGSAINLANRWKSHRSELNLARHHSRKLQNAWTKYGAQVFEFSVLEYVDDAAALIAKEQHWIDAQEAADAKGYNVSPTAGNCLGVRHSDETKAKHSAARKGQKHSEEARAAIAAARKGKTWTPEMRAKASAGKQNMSSETRQKMAESAKARPKRYGQVFTEETRAKIRAANAGKPSPNKGKPASEESRRNQSIAQKGRIAPNRGKPMSEEQKAKLRAAKQNISAETRLRMSEANKAAWAIRKQKKAEKKEAAQGSLFA